jgi:hypothetical protein
LLPEGGAGVGEENNNEALKQNNNNFNNLLAKNINSLEI